MESKCEQITGSKLACWAGMGVAGSATAAFAGPAAVAALGFGQGGIVAGSIAASMHSLAATTGFGMGIISTAQSIGAVGAVSHLAIATGGIAATGAAAISCGQNEECKWEN